MKKCLDIAYFMCYHYNVKDVVFYKEIKMDDVQRRNGLYGLEYRDHDLRRVEEDEERKTYDIKSLWQRSHEIINLAAKGFKQTDIARILGCCPATVSNTLNCELGQKKLSEIREERDEDAKVVAESIRVLTDKALKTYHEIFDNEGGQATLKERKDVADTVVLELSGLRAPTKHIGISANLTPAEIEEFKVRAKLAQGDNGSEVIDVEAEDAS